MSDYYDQRGVRRRSCCETAYNETHLDTCPERGVAARAALPCDITSDGWCAAHSTGAGPLYCTPTTAPTEALATTGEQA